jgi:hypothetical protein
MTPRVLAVLVLVPCGALAQARDDAPIPYGTEDAPRPLTNSPEDQRLRARLREDDAEVRAGARSLAHLDDPTVGLSAEAVLGAMLFASSRGAFVDPRFMVGVRLTWELRRLIADEFLRELFFLDVGWQFATTRDGTQQVHASATTHYFTLAPAVALPFGKSPLAGYAQLGAGLAYTLSSLQVVQGTVAETNLGGTRFLFQYGVGVRFRPELFRLAGPEVVRLSFRIELTRFLRGYLSDTFLGGSVGLTF